MAIWRHDGENWSLLAPSGFPSEAELHRLVTEAPHLLPLSGSPRLTVLGREVRLGGGYADLLAVEPSGRLVVIEIKLAGNPEARRAVVAQILAYAAYLRGMSLADVESQIAPFIAAAGVTSLAAYAQSKDQDGTLDITSFTSGVEESLATGRFRLVIVLDDAPHELIRLAGYLELIGEHLVIDLVTVKAYDVAGSRIVVPQRVDPEDLVVTVAAKPPTGFVTTYVEGGADFAAEIESAPEGARPALRTLYEWARQLEIDGVARLRTTRGRGRFVLIPRVTGEEVGIVSIWNDRGAFINIFGSVAARRAARAHRRLLELVPADVLGGAKNWTDFSPELLDILEAAYREAAELSV